MTANRSPASSLLRGWGGFDVGSINQADASQFHALHLQFPGQGLQGAVEQFKAEYATDLAGGKRRIGQNDLARTITIELPDDLSQWLAIKYQYPAPPTGGRAQVETGKGLYPITRAVAGTLTFHQGLPGRPLGRQRLQGRKPAASASAQVAWKLTFSRRAGRAAQLGRQ